MDSQPTILRVRAGSYAYGLSVDDSDQDFIEVYVESQRDVLGPYTGKVRPTHSSTPELDLARYPLRRFLHLALQGNPTVLESLWAPVALPAPPIDQWSAWQLGAELRALRVHFVGTHVIPRYLGYMHEQTKRLLGLRGGHSAGNESRKTKASEIVGYDTKYAAHVLRLGFQCLELLTTGELQMPMDEYDDRRLLIMAVRVGSVEFEDWFHEVLELDAQIKHVNSKLPQEPDRETVTKWSVGAHQRAWGLALA